MANLAEAVCTVACQPEPQIENFSLAGSEIFHQIFEGFLSLVIFLHHQRSGIRHGFGQFEIAVIIENGIQADRCPCRGLQVIEVLEAATGSLGQFLRAGEMLATMCQCFRFLLEQAEFLKMVRAEADEVTLPSHGNLQRLPNPPSGISRQSSSMGYIKAIDRLHEPANGFLEQVGITQGMMPKPFGDVGG